jgi:hypothetical protein
MGKHPGHPDREIGGWTIEGQEITFNKHKFTFSSRGGWATGTAGSFDIWIKEKGTKLCHCRWECPYWTSSNTWDLSGKTNIFDFLRIISLSLFRA